MGSEGTPMNTSTRWLSIAAIIVSAGLSAWAAEIKIIANVSVAADSIAPAELKSVYLLQRRALADGSSVTPVVRRSGATHQLFLKEYLDRDPEEIRTYYHGLVFTGKGSMPKEVDSDVEMVTYVARTRGAIGYVSSDASTEGVKMLAVAQQDHRRERRLLTKLEPEYPETLKRMGIGGTVKLELTISPRGEVVDALILGGNPILAESAVKAAKQWVYAPSPSTTTLQVAIPFDSQR